MYHKTEYLNKLEFLLKITHKAQGNSRETYRVYTSSYTVQPDIQRALQGKTDFYIKVFERMNPYLKKETIIHLPADYNDSALPSKNDFLKSTKRSGNIIKSLEDQLELFEIQNKESKDYDFIHHNADNVSTSDLKQQLSEQHKDVQGYHIVDYNDLLDSQEENNPLPCVKKLRAHSFSYAKDSRITRFAERAAEPSKHTVSVHVPALEFKS